MKCCYIYPAIYFLLTTLASAMSPFGFNLDLPEIRTIHHKRKRPCRPSYNTHASYMQPFAANPFERTFAPFNVNLHFSEVNIVDDCGESGGPGHNGIFSDPFGPQGLIGSHTASHPIFGSLIQSAINPVQGNVQEEDDERKGIFQRLKAKRKPSFVDNPKKFIRQTNREINRVLRPIRNTFRPFFGLF